MVEDGASAVASEVNALGVKIDGLAELTAAQGKATDLRIEHLEKDVWGDGNKGGLRGILGTQHVRIGHIETHIETERSRMSDKAMIALAVFLSFAGLGVFAVCKVVFMDGA